MNLDRHYKSYAMVNSNLHFENFDQADMTEWTHRLNGLS
jgi:hypothetical protein